MSVIIPIYGVEEFLPGCVRSVLDQTYRDLELILVDDGSPDGCPEIVDSFAEQDGRVVAIHQKNQGASAARNTGLRRARGRYVAFLDGDDYWGERDGLERCVKAISANGGSDLLFANHAELYQKSGHLISHRMEWSASRLAGNLPENAFTYLVGISDVRPSAWAKLISRTFLLENDLYFRPGIVSSEDIEWFLRLVLCQPKFGWHPTAFYIYRKDRAGSITNTIGVRNLRDLIETVKSASIATLEESHSDSFRAAYLAYCCYQFTIVLALYGRLTPVERTAVRADVMSLEYLLEYDTYGRGRMIRRIHRFLGMDGTARLLGTFLVIRSGLRSSRILHWRVT